MGKDYVMWSEVNLFNLVKKFLPNKADIIIMEGPYKKPAIIMADIDGDGRKEIVAAYKLKNEAYLVILKHYYNSWYMENNIKGKGYNVTYLKAAPVTSSKTPELIVGWQIGAIWSRLSILKWSNKRVRELIKDEIYFSKIEVEPMPSIKGINGTVEMALWSHVTGEIYEVKVYRWKRGYLRPAVDVYPYYFSKVVWYYKMKLRENPELELLWYFLGNAQFKAGMYQEALYSIKEALNGKISPSYKSKLMSIKSDIENMLDNEDKDEGCNHREINSETQKVEAKKDIRTNLYPVATKEIGGTLWGYIDSTGEFIIEPKFDYAMDFQDNGLAIVGVNNLQGAIDKEGRYVIEPKYENVIGFSEGRGAVIDKEGFKVINEKGEILNPKAYSFIGSYKDGRAVFSKTNKEGKYVYGYLDLEGREVIPAKYDSAGDFDNGKAIAKVKENQYELIDSNGNILNSYDYYFVGNSSDNLLPFSKNINDKYGYINEEGRVIIEPQFPWAGSFKEERALVNMSEDYLNKYGVIDKQGDLIIDPEYNNISFLGENRVSLGKAIDEEKPYMGSKFALADIDGKILTDFIFNNILEFKEGVASATDGKSTFFIGLDGKIEDSLPKVEGEGTLFLEDDIIKANIDYRTFYLNKNGTVIWSEDKVIPLNEKYQVMEEKYKPNKDYLVYYPKIQGIEDKELQQGINDKLKELALVKPVDANIQLDSSYVGDFSVEFFRKNLLVLELDGYEYYFGAAHGMPTKVYVHINLSNGNIYELKDLFKTDSNYLQVISDIVGKQIKDMGENFYIFPDTYKGIRENQPFYVDENNLYVYFTPYEIAAFAAGFPTFKIPFTEIANIINTEGEFWRSFHNNLNE